MLEWALRENRALVAWYAFVAIYFTVPEGLWGRTLGKRVVGLRIVGADSGRPPGVPRAAKRLVGRGISAVPLYLGYTAMLSDSRRRCWHDELVGVVCICDANRRSVGADIV